MKTPGASPRVGHFKADYAPEYLMAVNYICHLAVFKKSLFNAVGGERPTMRDVRRITTYSCASSMKCGALTPQPSRCTPAGALLLACTRHPPAAAQRLPYVEQAAQRAVADHLAATGRQGRAGRTGQVPGTCHVVMQDIPEAGTARIDFNSQQGPHRRSGKMPAQHLRQDDLRKFRGHHHREQLHRPATAAYYQKLPDRYDRARVVTYKGGFNFSRINNFGRKYAAGKYLLLLNN